MLSLIKNGQTLSSSTNPGSLRMDTNSIDVNQFGVYTCQLNASGVTFQKLHFLTEQGITTIAVFLTNSILSLLFCLYYSQFESYT